MKKGEINKSLVLFLLVLSLLGSCTLKDRKAERDFLNEVIGKMQPVESVRFIVILPGLGCNGCIQEGEAFLKEHVGNKDVLFILTKISSVKILEQKTGVKMDEHSTIYIDRNNEFIMPTDNSIYPCIIYLRNNNKVSYEFQSPKNGNTFGKLRKII